MATEAQLKAIKKYDDTHAVRFSMKLNKNTDADIISRLDEVPSKQGYIKRLIREDMAKGE